ncbi:MAG: hypothetical protein AAF265_11495, partial [Pseudomonadota bacterium]
MEIGGDYSWSVFPGAPVAPWPQPAVLYARGRDCIVGLARAGSLIWSTNQLWVPDYFCEDVAAAWQAAGVRVSNYNAMPGGVDGLPKGSPGDAVLVVNFFGVDNVEETTAKLMGAGYCVFEDHTHDPVGSAAAGSRAHYCLAALRKYLPITDGALLWSPQGLQLPEVPAERFDRHDGVAAMALKAAYESGQCNDKELKQRFRELQHAHHEQIEAGDAPLRPSIWSEAQLQSGLPLAWREQRDENARCLVNALSDAQGITTLFQDWGAGTVPYCVPVLFESEQARDSTRQALIASQVYPPVHWSLNQAEWDLAAALSRRILSLPCDHRYGVADMRRI